MFISIVGILNIMLFLKKNGSTIIEKSEIGMYNQ